jgi:N4-gp56 family major capsid protein
MAYFIRGTGQAVTPLKHSLEIYREYMLNMFFTNMMGKKGSGKPIIVDDTCFKGRDSGDVGRYHFIPYFRGEGIRGQNKSVIGNENTIDEYYMDMRIDQITQAFSKKGKMTDKRTIWNAREEFRRQLSEWFRNQTEIDIIDSLSGFNTDGATYISGAAAETQDAVTGDHRCIRPDYNNSKYETVEVSAANSDATSLLSAMNSNDIMNTQLLDVLQDFAKTADSKYAMRPIRAKNGEEYYMLVLHPRAAIDLRNDPRWEKRAIASMTGKNSLEGDPIATGAIGVWEHIIIREANFIKTHKNSGGTLRIARNLLLGADAAIMAYAQTLDYTEERLDHNRILSCAADEIRGIKKMTFDGCDLNIAQVPSSIRV